MADPKPSMPLVIIESPYRALPGEDPVIGRETNIRYLQACIRDSLRRGEAPFASHQMYTSALEDDIPEDRELGITAGLRWHYAADFVAVYTDRGITEGMRRGVAHAQSLDLPGENRHLGEDWERG